MSSTPPNVTVLRALWSLSNNIWGLLSGSWGAGKEYALNNVQDFYIEFWICSKMKIVLLSFGLDPKIGPIGWLGVTLLGGNGAFLDCIVNLGPTSRSDPDSFDRASKRT